MTLVPKTLQPRAAFLSRYNGGTFNVKHTNTIAPDLIVHKISDNQTFHGTGQPPKKNPRCRKSSSSINLFCPMHRTAERHWFVSTVSPALGATSNPAAVGDKKRAPTQSRAYEKKQHRIQVSDSKTQSVFFWTRQRCRLNVIALLRRGCLINAACLGVNKRTRCKVSCAGYKHAM